MRRSWFRSTSLAAALALSAGCVSHTHIVGLGAAGAETQVQRQYYWLLGAVEVNDVEAQRMAGDLTSYTIETEFGIVDLVLLPLLLPLLATSRTVIVRT